MKTSLPRIGAAVLALLILLAAANLAQARFGSSRLFLPVVARAVVHQLNPSTPFDLPKGPTLIYTGSSSEMRIVWEWPSSTNFRIDWGPSLSSLSGSADVLEYDPAHHLYGCTLTGLNPGSAYQYRVVLGDEYTNGSFRTAPGAGASTLKFISYGDTRTIPSAHNAVAGQVLGLFQSDPLYQTFNLMVGDWVYHGDQEQAWVDELFSPTYQHIHTLLGSTAYLSAIGNHEGTGVLFQRYFPLTYTASRYGSFDYGPAHIVLVDQYVPYNPGSAQYSWLEADLAATTKTWKFVVLHEPGWSAAGAHPNNSAVQTNLQPLFETYAVAAVFAGHNHYYARAEVNGITHLTVGTGGAPTTINPDFSSPNLVKVYLGTGYTRIAIDGHTLSGEMVGSDGGIKDSFSITR